MPKLVRGYTYTIVGAANFNAIPTNIPPNATYNITNQYLHGTIALSYNTGMKYGAKPFRTYTTTPALASLYRTEPLSSLFAVSGWNCLLLEETITIDAASPLGNMALTFDSMPPTAVSDRLGSVEILATEPPPIDGGGSPMVTIGILVLAIGVSGTVIALVARKRRHRRR